MIAEWTSGRAFKAECGKETPESSSHSLERSEGEKIRGGIRGGLSLRQRVILAGLASVMITLSASAGGARSNELMSSFPDPDERPHASKELEFLRKETATDRTRLQSSLRYPEMARGISQSFAPALRFRQQQQWQHQKQQQQQQQQQPASWNATPGRSTQTLRMVHRGTRVERGREKGAGGGDRQTKGMSIVDMAIHDIQSHHDQRFRATLKNEMKAAAKDYASDVDTAVKWEKQSEGTRAASRARELREEMAQQRAERRAKQRKEGWGEVAKKSGRVNNGAHSARSDSGGWYDLF